jgi:hypothetical protein
MEVAYLFVEVRSQKFKEGMQAFGFKKKDTRGTKYLSEKKNFENLLAKKISNIPECWLIVTPLENESVLTAFSKSIYIKDRDELLKNYRVFSNVGSFEVKP